MKFLNRKPNVKPNGRLAAYTDPRSPVAEAYRTLRTNIQFAALDKPITTLLVTGSNPSCGKTTTAANLSVVLAQADSAVLLVDTDLRRPTQHKIMDVHNYRGLTNLLVDLKLDLDKVVNRTGVDNLHLLTSGPIPPNPAELLATNKMKHVVTLLKERYDYVVFDSPPVAAVTDAAILSRLVDATVMVVDYGVVTCQEAAFALGQLNKVQANVIGVVINNVPNHKGGHYYYYYYGDRRGQNRRRNLWTERDKDITMTT